MNDRKICPKQCPECGSFAEAYKLQRGQYVDTNTMVFFRCGQCSVIFQAAYTYCRVEPIFDLWVYAQKFVDDFFYGPVLTIPTKYVLPKKYGRTPLRKSLPFVLQTPEVFTLAELGEFVLKNPKGWALRQHNPTKHYPLPYTTIRFGHAFWLGRGLPLDVLWANWRQNKVESK